MGFTGAPIIYAVPPAPAMIRPSTLSLLTDPAEDLDVEDALDVPPLVVL